MMRCTAWTVAFPLAFHLCGADAAADIIYADSSLGGDCAGSYSIAARDCTGSDGNGFDTLSEAAAAASAGDSVLVRAGEYHEALSPPSGQPGQPITIGACSGEQVTLPGAAQPAVHTAIDLDGVSHVVLEGLTVQGAERYIRAEGAHHIEIRACHFEGAVHGGAAMKFHLAHHNRLIGNHIEGGYDLIMLRGSDHNLVQGNQLIEAEHALFAIRCGSHNIVRDNTLYNETNKIGEIYDCCDSGLGNELATERNLVEGNVFARTSWDDGDYSPEAGIQFAGQRTIVRRNVFYDCLGGINLAVYAGSNCNVPGSYEAYRCRENRLVHNVFYGNHRGGMIVSAGEGPDVHFGDNAIVNNIFAANDFVLESVAWDWWTDHLAGQPIQFLFGRLDGFAFQHNSVVNAPGDEDWACVAGSWQQPLLHPPVGNGSIATWEAELPALFSDNVTTGPGFVDPAGGDYQLAATSPLIDEGAFLTHTVGAGSGTVVPVLDARFFHAGLGVDGELGDLVQLQGETDPVRVQAVDLATQELTVDQPLDWSADQGVALAYEGDAPDIGAFEHGAPATGGGGSGSGAGGTGGSSAGGGPLGGGGTGGAAPPPAGSSSDDGCSCRLAARGGSGSAALLLFVIAIIGLLRRCAWTA